MIRALVVDDEPLARRKLVALLRDVGDVEVAGECPTGHEAIAAIRGDRVDLVFLDVQMPEVSGLDVVEAIGAERMPATVFVTAYDQYAVRAFEMHAVDYLLKPFARARFQATLDRARHRISAGAPDRRLDEVLAALGAGRSLRQITVQEEGRTFFVAVDEISRIESEGNYLRIHAVGGSHLVRGTLKGIEAHLDPTRFVRTARGALVSLAHVREIQPWFRGELVLILRDGARLTVSAGFAPRVRAAIENPF